MEVWDVLNKNRELTGEKIIRGEKMNKKQYHLVVHVWIKNKNNQYLISKRTPNKVFPLMWESTGGSAISGDSSLSSALREVKEEIGITLTPSKGKCVYSFKREYTHCNDFVDVWLFEEDISIEDVIYQEDEVCDAKYATKNEIKEMTIAGLFYNGFNYLEDLFNM